MRIRLAKKGPAMWFLGEPKNIILSLTYEEPGPVEIDFNKLSKFLQQKVLNGIVSKQIETSENYGELYAIWLEGQIIEQVVPIQQPTKEDLMRQQLAATREKTEKDIMEKCDFLLSNQIKAVKYAIRHEDNLRILRRLFVTENGEKKRKNILECIQSRIEKLTIQEQRKIYRDINKKQKKSNGHSTISNKTNEPDVIEYDQETIILTPNDLIKEVAKDILGGE